MKTYTETEIAAAAEEYVARLGIDAVDVCRNYEGDGPKIIGYRLSRDTDGGQHGDDEHHGLWNGIEYQG